MTSDQYVTPEIKAMIGTEGRETKAKEPISRLELRRFIQATMDRAPIYWDDDYTKNTRYGGVVCPPLLPLSIQQSGAASAFGSLTLMSTLAELHTPGHSTYALVCLIESFLTDMHAHTSQLPGVLGDLRGGGDREGLRGSVSE